MNGRRRSRNGRPSLFPEDGEIGTREQSLYLTVGTTERQYTEVKSFSWH